MRRSISRMLSHPEHQSKPALWLVQKGVNPRCEYNLRAWPRQHPRRAEPRKLRHTLCRTRHRQWCQRSAAFGQKSRPATKRKRKIYVIWDNAAYHKSEEVREIPIPPQKPHPPHQTAALLPASEPDRTAVESHAWARDLQPILSHRKAIYGRNIGVFPRNHPQKLERLPRSSHR